MNLYFLLEGRRTAPKVYPSWLTILLPQFSQVKRAADAQANNYYIISGQGFPRLLDITLPDAVDEVKECGNYDYLIIVVDSDDLSVTERIKEIEEHSNKYANELGRCHIKIVVQNCCIETWFLGNRTVFPRTPQDATLRQYIQHYSVYVNDPEPMTKHETFKASKAEFHYIYLKLMLKERNVSYSKKSPHSVKDAYYLQQLIERTKIFPTHLLSFQEFLLFCESINSVDNTVAA